MLKPWSFFVGVAQPRERLKQIEREQHELNDKDINDILVEKKKRLRNL